MKPETKAGHTVLRVGMVNFINTAPIYIPWQEMGSPEGVQVVESHPTELNRMLAEGRLDVGLVSSHAYGSEADRYLLLPDLGISATGPVGSVLLLSRIPVSDLHGRSVLLTPQSATSVNLLRIVLEDFFGIQPRYVTGGFAEREHLHPRPQAYLAIGDEALRLASLGRDWTYLDLAEIWLRETGVPFVFAVWAVRRESWEEKPGAIRALNRRLHECYVAGQASLARISSLVAPRIPMDLSACLAYLSGIELDLSPEKQRGLLYFFERLHQRGDFPQVSSLAMVPEDA